MALPGLLVEYLISGGLAVAWLWPLLSSVGGALTEVPLPVLGLGLYAIGMLVDFSAFILLGPAKRWLRRRVATRHGLAPTQVRGVTAARQVQLLLEAPELFREVAMRSSRDRIARGATLNCLLAMIMWRAVVPWYAGLALVAACAWMWAFFEQISYTFEIKAEEAIAARKGDEYERSGR